METILLFMLLGGAGAVIALGLVLIFGATKRALLGVGVAGVALLALYSVYLAAGEFGDDYGVCGECTEFLGNDVPILFVLSVPLNAAGWIVGLVVGGGVRWATRRRRTA